MTRTVNGERLFKDREKEILRKMIWQVADFSGVEVLTYAVMANHFHVLIHVPEPSIVSDAELMRRWRVLYPKPTTYETATASEMERLLAQNGEEAAAVRRRLLTRMGDVSQFMKTLKQRFSIWFNKSHDRYGTLWADRFKSVLVEGKGNALQTMAAYIDLNPVRAGLVTDPKDYRFCGYAEAVTGRELALAGLRRIWSAYADATPREAMSNEDVLQSHRSLLFGKGASGAGMSRAEVLKVLEKQDGVLPRAQVLRCRVRYFTDGAVLGSAEYVRRFLGVGEVERGRKHPLKAHRIRGANWDGLAVLGRLRGQLFE